MALFNGYYVRVYCFQNIAPPSGKFNWLLNHIAMGSIQMAVTYRQCLVFVDFAWHP